MTGSKIIDWEAGHEAGRERKRCECKKNGNEIHSKM